MNSVSQQNVVFKKPACFSEEGVAPLTGIRYPLVYNGVQQALAFKAAPRRSIPLKCERDGAHS
jgi:hypothetical protein